MQCACQVIETAREAWKLNPSETDPRASAAEAEERVGRVKLDWNLLVSFQRNKSKVNWSKGKSGEFFRL